MAGLWLAARKLAALTRSPCFPKAVRPLPKANDYSLFGLTVRSELPLPELVEADAGEFPDVMIVVQDGQGGRVDGADRLTLSIEGVARFEVVGGSTIMVAPARGIPPENVRLYLLGSAMGMLLHQRQLLPLHASAVEIGGKAFAFLGQSGAGKSTLCAALHDRGFPIVADDVCVVRFGDKGRAWASPGLPRLRLWRDSLEASGRDASTFPRSYAGDESWEKYDVGLPLTSTVPGPIELAAFYQLRTGATIEVSRVGGLEAVTVLMANTYRGALIAKTNGAHSHWEDCTRLAKLVPAFEFSRPHDYAELEASLDQLIEHARSMPR